MMMDKEDLVGYSNLIWPRVHNSFAYANAFDPKLTFYIKQFKKYFNGYFGEKYVIGYLICKNGTNKNKLSRWEVITLIRWSTLIEKLIFKNLILKIMTFLQKTDHVLPPGLSLSSVTWDCDFIGQSYWKVWEVLSHKLGVMLPKDFFFNLRFLKS